MNRCMFVILLLVAAHKSASSSNGDSTVVYIKNSIGGKVRFQIESTPSFFFEGYDSDKKNDTLLFKTSSPFRLICYESVNQTYTYYTFLLNVNEKVTIYKDNQGFKIKSNQENEIRNNELNFFIRMQKSIGNFEGEVTYIPHKRKNVDSLFKKVAELYEKRIAFLENYKTKYPTSIEFEKSLRTIFKNKQRYDFLNHCQLTSIFNRDLLQKREINELISSIYDEKVEQDIYFFEALKLANRLRYLDESNLQNYHKTREMYSGSVRDYLLYDIINLSYKDNYLGQLAEDYLKISTNDALKNDISNKYGDFLGDSLILAKPAYDYTKESLLYHLKTDKFISWDSLLKQGEGKYIDFWATWCGGCRVNLQYTKKLSDEYISKGVRVIYVSKDENVKAWAKISRKEQIPDEDSYLLLDPAITFIHKKYNIKSIPRYMVCDKEGNIVNEEAPHPNSTTVKSELDKVVK